MPLVSGISSLDFRYAFAGHGTLLVRSGDPLWSAFLADRNSAGLVCVLERFVVYFGLWTLVLQAQQPVDSLLFTKRQMTRANISLRDVYRLSCFIPGIELVALETKQGQLNSRWGFSQWLLYDDFQELEVILKLSFLFLHLALTTLFTTKHY